MFDILDLMNILYLLTFPIILLVFGILFTLGYPRERNRHFGFRTPITMRSERIWRYAHDTAAKPTLCSGIILTVVCAILLFLTKGRVAYWQATLIFIVSAVIFILIVQYVNRKIKDNFP